LSTFRSAQHPGRLSPTWTTWPSSSTVT
jgi:hypothetical protein